jgi:hypothetical protein
MVSRRFFAKRDTGMHARRQPPLLSASPNQATTASRIYREKSSFPCKVVLIAAKYFRSAPTAAPPWLQGFAVLLERPALASTDSLASSSSRLSLNEEAVWTRDLLIISCP